jgi:replicative DNA helicase
VLLDDTRFPEIAAALTSEDFSVEKHRRIFARMIDHQGDVVISSFRLNESSVSHTYSV